MVPPDRAFRFVQYSHSRSDRRGTAPSPLRVASPVSADSILGGSTVTIASRLRLASLSLALLGVALLCAPSTSAERLTSGPRPKSPSAKAVPIGEEVRTASNQRRRLVLSDGSVVYVNQSTSLKV